MAQRKELMADMQLKDEIEDEIKAIDAFLTNQGVPGLHGGLVDAQGFPRADIDVHAIRNSRHRLACTYSAGDCLLPDLYTGLQTDHVAVMKRIEQGLLEVRIICRPYSPSM